MSIPLNIDWQQILLHFFNFFILSGGLYFLLYKPVKTFMDNRQAYYQTLLNEADEELFKAQETKKTYEDKLADIDAEIVRRYEAADEKLAKEEAYQKAKAREEAAEIIAKAKADAAFEKEKTLAQTKEEMMELAAAAAEQIIKQTLEERGV